MHGKKTLIIATIAAVLMLCGITFFIPAVRSRAESVWLMVRSFFSPVDDEIIIPQSTIDAAFQATVAALAPTVTPMPTSTPVMVTATPLPEDTPTAIPSPTAISGQAMLEDITYYSQHAYWNYCAPANLAMGLSYYGWQGELPEIGDVVKPGEWDKNVMPYELVDYATRYTFLTALERSGGTLELLKKLISAGYPVIIEKGVILPDSCNGGKTWMGHYQTVAGYDDEKGVFYAYDSYVGTEEKPVVSVSYADMLAGWRPFNYIFIVPYTYNREADLMQVLGDYADSTRADQIALATAITEAQTLTGSEQFFALYNKGTSQVHLGSYADGAAAYDQAYTLYNDLAKPRPFRMTWYQTGPYFAYFYSGRFQTVIDLADKTIRDVCVSSFSKPGIEETWIWRARAKAALGDIDGAVEDLRQSLFFHPGFQPALDLAAQLGVQP